MIQTSDRLIKNDFYQPINQGHDQDMNRKHMDFNLIKNQDKHKP